MQALKKIGFGVLILGIVLLIAFLAGPKVQFEPVVSPEIPDRSFTLSQVDSIVTVSQLIPNLRPDNGSRIYWADSIPSKTTWSLVYIHGFSASPEEGDPVFVELGKRYGMNVFVPVLPGHGQQVAEAFLDLTPNQLIEAAKQAVQVGNSIGDSLIVMSCSTGSTLALYLAGANPDKIDVMMMYSPNIELEDPAAKLLTGPWGKQIAYRAVGKYKSWKKPGEPINAKDQYWTTSYRVEGLITLQSLLDNTVTDNVLTAVSQPYFIGYYYKNEEERDKTVSLEAIKRFNEIASTPDNQRVIVEFPNVGAHVMTSSIQSQDVQSVVNRSFEFVEQVVGIKPVSK